MAGITLEKGKRLYSQGQSLTALHLITGGKVQVTYPGGTYQLVKGDVIGIGEICSEVHFLDYTVLEDAVLLTYPLANLDALEDLLQKHTDIARLFLLSLFRQINTLQSHCSISEMNCSNLYHNLTEDYEKYINLCNLYRLTPRTLDGIDEIEAYLVEESPDLWVNGYYMGLAHIYASEHYKIFTQEAAVSLGMLRKGSLDFRKTFLSLDEQYHYQQQLTDFYFKESCNDLFDFYTSLYSQIGSGSEDAQAVLQTIDRMLQNGKESGCIDSQLLDNRMRAFRGTAKVPDSVAPKQPEDIDKSTVHAELIGSLNTILKFANLEEEAASSFRHHVEAYRALEDRSALEDKINALRKQLTAEFNALYCRVFKNTLNASNIPMPVRMLLYFGYVDEELAGIANANKLYEIANSLSNHSTSGFYTFYDWLLAIYNGKKEPSRNEFDQDYNDYIHKQKSSKQFTDAQIRQMENDPIGKVEYELNNMFPQVNKITFGRITSFCPLFSADNVLKDLDASLVTLSKICKVIEQVKKVDYSAFYRESLDMEHINTMGKEPIHLEFVPDIILMPNVGIRGAMWQEIEGKRRNSPGRMMFSIFHMEDLNTSFIRLVGEFRWELCKRVQGARWNDVAERSLTSEYFDYVQFYRKNHDLTAEAKERVRTSLQRAKNSFKEMFVRDYLVWILFEGNGSPRLNKVARTILFTYCPFPYNTCSSLEQNPLYTDILHRHRIHIAQKKHHLEALRKKITSSGAQPPYTLEAELKYIEGTIQ